MIAFLSSLVLHVPPYLGLLEQDSQELQGIKADDSMPSLACRLHQHRGMWEAGVRAVVVERRHKGHRQRGALAVQHVVQRLTARLGCLMVRPGDMCR